MRLFLLACLFLIACGGGEDNHTRTGYCPGSNGDFYCVAVSQLEAGSVQVTIEGQVTGQGTRSFAVLVDDVPQQAVTASAGPFRLRHSFTATAGTHRIGYITTSLTGATFVADGAKISIEAQ